MRVDRRAPLQAWVTTARGVRVALANPLNRVTMHAASPRVARIVVRRDGTETLNEETAA